MRSCEYLETNTKEEFRRTKILRLRNIAFRKNSRRLSHQDPNLHTADLVIITFEFQKNDKRDISIHMFATTDSQLNPVVAWNNTVRRVWSYPNASVDSKVCEFFNPASKARELLKTVHVQDYLRSIVDLIGEDILGFTKDDIGLH